ncbi:MAG: PAS domain S-box protein [Reichenbachiella sp.]
MMEKSSPTTSLKNSAKSNFILNQNGELLEFTVEDFLKPYFIKDRLTIGMNAFEIKIIDNLHEQINYANQENITLTFERVLNPNTDDKLFTIHLCPSHNQISITIEEALIKEPSTALPQDANDYKSFGIFFITDEKNCITEINPDTKDHLGLNLSGAIGLDLSIFLQSEELVNKIKKEVETHTRINDEHIALQDITGQIRNFELTVKAKYDKNTIKDGLVGVLKKTENLDFIFSSDDIKEFFSLSSNAILLSDSVSTQVIKTNDKSAQILGVDINSLESLSLISLFGHQSAEFNYKITHLEEGKIFKTDLSYIKNNDVPILLELSSKKVVSGYRNFIYSTITDITHLRLKNQINQLQFDILQETSDGRPIQTVINHICETIKQSLDAKHCVFFTVDEHKNYLHQESTDKNIPSDLLSIFKNIKPGFNECPSGQSAFHKKSICFDSEMMNERKSDVRIQTLTDHGIKSCWSVPILKSNNSVLGVILLLFPTSRPENKELIEIIEQLCQIIGFIIEHKASEDKLKSTETRYKDLVTSSPMGIAIHNRNHFIFANKEACNILNIDHSKLIGKNVVDFVKAEDIKSHHKQLKTIHKTGEIPLREETLVTHTGKEISVLIRDVSINFKGTRCNQVVFYDITELKKAEKDLIESQQLLNKTGLAAQVGGWSLDVTEMSLKWTDQTYLIHGLKIGSPLDVSTAINYYHPEDRAEVSAVIEQCMTSGTPWNKTWRLITALGETIWVNATGEATYLDKKLVQISGTFRDISYFKKQEETLKNNTQKLKNAHRLAKLGSWEYIIDERKMSWSSELYEILNVPQGSDVSVNSFRTLIHPDYKNKFDDYVEYTLQKNISSTIDLKIISPVTKQAKYVLAIVDCLIDNKGELIKTSGTVQDITDRKLLELSEARRTKYSQVLLEFGIMSSNANNKWFIINQCCIALVNKIGFDCVWVSNDSQSDTQQITVPPHHLSEKFKKKIKVSSIIEFEKQISTLAAKTTSKAVVIENLSLSMIDEEWKQYMLNIGINSYASIPYYQDEKNQGTINLYSRKAIFIDEGKTDFLTQVASELGKNLNTLALKKSRKELNEYNKLLINSLNVFSVKMDLHTGSIDISGDSENFVGYSSDELTGVISHYKDYLIPSEIHDIRSGLLESQNNFGHFDVDFRFKKKDDTFIWLKSIGKAHWQGTTLRKLVAIFIDITAQKEREIKLVKAQVKGRDDERRRIAKDIHDSLGQLLTVANLNIQSIKKEVSSLSPQKQQVYSDTCDIINEALDEARDMSHSLMPSLLIDFGLTRSIKSDIQRISKTVDIEFNFIEFVDKKRYHIDIESNIYNIARECINNAVKHSEAKNIDIQLQEIDTKLVLTIDDNGIGFDPNEPKDGIGMQNIKSRVFSLNGELHIESKNGTHISVEVEMF